MSRREIVGLVLFVVWAVLVFIFIWIDAKKHDEERSKYLRETRP